MSFFEGKLSTLDDLFAEQLKDLYSAEKQLVQALPKMAKAANTEALKEGFQEHLDQTRTHVDRLEQIFTRMGASPGRKKCEAMEGLIQEGEEAIELKGDAAVRDAALIAAAQRFTPAGMQPDSDAAIDLLIRTARTHVGH